MIIIGGALLAGFLSASSTDFADAPRQSSCEHPLSALPSGWIHVPQRTVDTWTGAFHDSLSGAFASFDVTTTANTASESRANGNGAETTQGIADGIPYEVTRTVDPATTGAQNAAPDVRGAPALKGTVAPDRARISVSFRSAARVWVFRATAYSRLQEERVRALLLGSDARLCHMQPTRRSWPRNRGGRPHISVASARLARERSVGASRSPSGLPAEGSGRPSPLVLGQRRPVRLSACKT